MKLLTALRIAAKRLLPELSKDQRRGLISKVIEEHDLIGVDYCEVVTLPLVYEWIKQLKRCQEDPFTVLSEAYEEIANCIFAVNGPPEEQVCPFDCCDALMS